MILAASEIVQLWMMQGNGVGGEERFAFHLYVAKFAYGVSKYRGVLLQFRPSSLDF